MQEDYAKEFYMHTDSIKALKAEWKGIFLFIKHISQEDIEAEFENLVTRYSEPHRHYHTLKHIEDCLHLLNDSSEANHIAVHKNELALAIWYHDAVYDTRAKDNEAQSAELFTEFAKKVGLDEWTIKRVCGWILASTHTGKALESDQTFLFLDIDLSVLGADLETYATYDRHIREEYVWVPEADYIAGRTKVLQSFLDRPHIFRTEKFRQAFEQRARENITLSLAALREGRLYC